MGEILEVDDVAYDGEYGLKEWERIREVKNNMEEYDSIYSSLTDLLGKSAMFLN